MFKERKTKLTLLSLLSALVVVSTAFAGVSIYAQQADDNTTTTEESGIGDAIMLNGSDDDSEDSGVNASETSTTASVSDIFSGLVVCDLGTLTVNDETEVAADLNGTTPTITITVMDRTEIAAAAENDTSTAADDASSADCMELGETSTSNATESTGNATSDNGNATSTSNATSLGDASLDDEELTTFEEEALLGNESSNATSAANATDTDTSGNATSAADATSASEDEGQIVAIDGEDFAPGQVVLVFTDNALVAVDDVDEDGSIEAKVPLEDVDNELRFVESGTMRTATASFVEGDTQDETVIAGSEDQDIQIVMAGDSEAEAETADLTGNATSTSSDNATSTNSTSTNSTDDIYGTEQ